MAMLPYGDEPDRDRRRFPWVMLALNVLVFVYELSLPPRALEAFFRAWGAVPPRSAGDAARPPTRRS